MIDLEGLEEVESTPLFNESGELLREPTPEESREMLWRSGELKPDEDRNESLRAIFDASQQGADAQERAADQLERIADNLEGLRALLERIAAQFVDGVK